MTWQSPNAYARQTMQNPIGFAPAARAACPQGWYFDPRYGRCMRAGGEPPPPQPPKPPKPSSRVTPGVSTRTPDWGGFADCVGRCNDLFSEGSQAWSDCIGTCSVYERSRQPRPTRLTLLNNPIVNAARAVGRLATGTPKLQGRRASRPTAGTGTSTRVRKCVPEMYCKKWVHWPNSANYTCAETGSRCIWV